MSIKPYFEYKKNNALINCVTQNDLNQLVLQRDVVQQLNHYFPHKVKTEGKATNQKSSGRCWIFAALNMMRLPTIDTFKLPNDFEFSQSYVFFWDKLERCNYFLECIQKTINKEIGSREIDHLVKDPLCDGGQWDMFVNIVEKYGVVPKSVYNESYNSSNSRRMNWVLTYKLREYACKMRNGTGKTKGEYLNEIYRLLCTFLGEPPKTFDWEYVNKENEYKKVSGLTPKQFYQDYVPVQLDDYICLIHDPRNEYHTCYSVQYLGNVVEGRSVKYINVPIEEIKECAVKSIKDNESVWFGCDVGKWFERKNCVMDTSILNYKDILETEFTMNKKERLEYGESLMTHAMLFTGVDCEEQNNTVQNQKETSVHKWRVENSWSDSGPTKGYYVMTDAWFNEFVYEVVVKKKYIQQNTINEYNNGQVVTFPPWDPLGALA